MRQSVFGDDDALQRRSDGEEVYSHRIHGMVENVSWVVVYYPRYPLYMPISEG